MRLGRGGERERKEWGFTRVKRTWASGRKQAEQDNSVSEPVAHGCTEPPWGRGRVGETRGRTVQTNYAPSSYSMTCSAGAEVVTASSISYPIALYARMRFSSILARTGTFSSR